jgi:hypothetical protein
MTGKYDVCESCNYCGGDNNETIQVYDTINWTVSSCKTKCRDCGKYDIWDTGHFMSSTEIVGKCKKY